MTKRWIAWLLVLVLLLSLGASAFAAEEGFENEDDLAVPADLIRQMGYSAAYAVAQGVNPDDIVFYDHVTVANTTQLHGDFFTDLWGNATSDMDVRNFLHGYNLVRWDGNNGMFTTDPAVVSAIAVTENAAGDKTYTFTLNDSLRYSDGSPITAWDYAFTFLLTMSDEIQGAGAVPYRRDFIVGSGNFRSGARDILSGVRVPADNTIAITLSSEYLPFFYEMGLLSCNPYPISVIAPGVSVYDNGAGVYLANSNGAGGAPVYSTDLLNRTINDPVNGYRTHPSVVSGPYLLTGFDGVTADFTRNPYYIGNADNELPLIEKVTYTLANNAGMIDKLEAGEYDVLNKVTDASSITGGLSLIADGDVAMSSYPRSGLSFALFTCENPTVSSAAVRQAIALCMDRDDVVSAYTGNYGLRVDGFYGVGQWMYGLVSGTMAYPVTPPEDTADEAARAEYEKELEAWEALTIEDLDPYALDLERAAALMDDDGWVLNADGLREKQVDGQATVLDLTMLYPEGNRIAGSFEQSLIPNLARIGIRLTLKAAPTTEVTAAAHQASARDADMIYMASNFDLVFDPAVYFNAEENNGRTFTQVKDRELYDLAVQMRSTEPGNVLAYMQAWVAFQERFNEELPLIPLYSNVYFDFYTSLMHDYDVAQSSTWSEALIGAVKAEIPELPADLSEDDVFEASEEDPAIANYELPAASVSETAVEPAPVVETVESVSSDSLRIANCELPIELTVTPTMPPKNGVAYRPGEVVTFLITAINHSSENLRNLTVSDSLSGKTFLRFDFLHGAKLQFLAGYTVTEEDALNSVLRSEVTASAVSWSGEEYSASPFITEIPAGE